jgi:5-methylcytosine-specific restriction endonuclease McrA
MKSAGTVDLMDRVARTDKTFELVDGHWLGKCLICNGRLSFRTSDGFGANIEHIYPRVLGGTDALENLALTHPGCNGEKGRNWDKPRQHRAPERNLAYLEMVKRFQERRRERWRDPEI